MNEKFIKRLTQTFLTRVFRICRYGQGTFHSSEVYQTGPTGTVAVHNNSYGTDQHFGSPC